MCSFMQVNPPEIGGLVFTRWCADSRRERAQQDDYLFASKAKIKYLLHTLWHTGIVAKHQQKYNSRITEGRE